VAADWIMLVVMAVEVVVPVVLDLELTSDQ
jgi:hypothetical protein